MIRLALAVLLLLPVTAQAADSAWVQATISGFEARLVTTAATCPVLHTDKGDVAMTIRAPASADFPLVCSAAILAGTAQARAGDTALPLPVVNSQRILVL